MKKDIFQYLFLKATVALFKEPANFNNVNQEQLKMEVEWLNQRKRAYPGVYKQKKWEKKQKLAVDSEDSTSKSSEKDEYMIYSRSKKAIKNEISPLDMFRNSLKKSKQIQVLGQNNEASDRLFYNEEQDLAFEPMEEEPNACEPQVYVMQEEVSSEEDAEVEGAPACQWWQCSTIQRVAVPKRSPKHTPQISKAGKMLKEGQCASKMKSKQQQKKKVQGIKSWQWEFFENAIYRYEVPSISQSIQSLLQSLESRPLPQESKAVVPEMMARGEQLKRQLRRELTKRKFIDVD